MHLTVELEGQKAKLEKDDGHMDSRCFAAIGDQSSFSTSMSKHEARVVKPLRTCHVYKEHGRPETGYQLFRPETPTTFETWDTLGLGLEAWRLGSLQRPCAHGPEDLRTSLVCMTILRYCTEYCVRSTP